MKYITQDWARKDEGILYFFQRLNSVYTRLG